MKKRLTGPVQSFLNKAKLCGKYGKENDAWDNLKENSSRRTVFY